MREGHIPSSIFPRTVYIIDHLITRRSSTDQPTRQHPHSNNMETVHSHQHSIASRPSWPSPLVQLHVRPPGAVMHISLNLLLLLSILTFRATDVTTGEFMRAVILQGVCVTVSSHRASSTPIFLKPQPRTSCTHITQQGYVTSWDVSCQMQSPRFQHCRLGSCRANLALWLCGLCHYSLTDFVQCLELVHPF